MTTEILQSIVLITSGFIAGISLGAILSMVDSGEHRFSFYHMNIILFIIFLIAYFSNP